MSLVFEFPLEITLTKKGYLLFRRQPLSAKLQVMKFQIKTINQKVQYYQPLFCTRLGFVLMSLEGIPQTNLSSPAGTDFWSKSTPRVIRSEF